MGFFIIIDFYKNRRLIATNPRPNMALSQPKENPFRS